MTTPANMRNLWGTIPGLDETIGQQLAQRIAETFGDVDIELNESGGVPSVEFCERQSALTRTRILELGGRLQEIVDGYPVRLLNAHTSYRVTFLLMHEPLRCGVPFNEAQHQYGLSLAECNELWAAQPDADAASNAAPDVRKAILLQAIHALPVSSIREAKAIRALMAQ